MILSYFGRLYLKVFGPRSLDKILSAFQRAHDELAELENHHQGQHSRIEDEVNRMRSAQMEHGAQRDRARAVRVRLKDFLPR